MLTLLRALKVMFMIGMVVVVPNVYWEQPGSVISQSTHSGGRLLFCSTVLLLRTYPALWTSTATAVKL